MKANFFFLILFLLSFTCLAAAQDDARPVVRKVMPVMPPIAKQINLTGTVKLDVTVAASGRVSEVKAIGGNPILLDAAMSAVKQWVYAPGTHAETVQVAVSFKE
jgi:TonB family protein